MAVVLTRADYERMKEMAISAAQKALQNVGVRQYEDGVGGEETRFWLHILINGYGHIVSLCESLIDASGSKDEDRIREIQDKLYTARGASPEPIEGEIVSFAQEVHDKYGAKDRGKLQEALENDPRAGGLGEAQINDRLRAACKQAAASAVIDYLEALGMRRPGPASGAGAAR